MAALAADKFPLRTRADSGKRMRTGKVAAATKIFHGALIAKNAAGFIVPASDAADLKVVGVAQGQVDNSAGANGAKEVTYLTGLDVELDNAGGAIVQAGMHGLCYVADDQSVTTAAVAVNDVVAGLVTDFTAAKVWVHVDEAINAVA